jgi:hypothetical protein
MVNPIVSSTAYLYTSLGSFEDGIHQDRADGSVLIYPASEAPNYKIGYKAASAFCVACLISTGVFKWKDRQLRRRDRHQEHEVEVERRESSSGRNEDPTEGSRLQSRNPVSHDIEDKQLQ